MINYLPLPSTSTEEFQPTYVGMNYCQILFVSYEFNQPAIILGVKTGFNINGLVFYEVNGKVMSLMNMVFKLYIILNWEIKLSYGKEKEHLETVFTMYKNACTY